MNSDFSTIHHKIQYIFGLSHYRVNQEQYPNIIHYIFGFQTNQMSFTIHYLMYFWFKGIENNTQGDTIHKFLVQPNFSSNLACLQ